MTLRGVAVVLLASGAAAAEAPRIVKLDPPELFGDVDSKTTARLTVVFDEPKSTTGFSWCGGGSSFPPGEKALAVTPLPQHGLCRRSFRLSVPRSGH